MVATTHAPTSKQERKAKQAQAQAQQQQATSNKQAAKLYSFFRKVKRRRRRQAALAAYKGDTATLIAQKCYYWK